MSRHRLAVSLVAVVVLVAVGPVASAPEGGLASINSRDLQHWLTYVASDELQGRGAYSTGLGLAAAYITDHLRAWGAVPAGDHGSYLQTVRVLSVKAVSRSTLTVEVGGQTRTFADGQGIKFPKNVGGKRQLTVDRVEFAGYGLDAPAVRQEDFRGRDVKGAAVVWLGAKGPKELDPAQYRRLLAGRSRYAIEQLHAAASIGPDTSAASAVDSGAQGRSAGVAGAEGSGSARIPRSDFTTVQRLDRPIPPTVSGTEGFFEFLFSRAPIDFETLKRKAEAREPLPGFRLEGVTLTFNLDTDYEIVRTQLTQNIVAVIDGSDAQLKTTYLAFGAHYDHVGYAEGEVSAAESGPQRLGAPGRVTAGAEHDRIWNGADDDGSGTVALLALARAFTQGPRPKRSLMFVWHTGEERGLLGSRYFADYPTIPLDRVVAHLNMDMIGRNRDDKPSESNTVYIVGSDRISSELDAINRAANEALPRPLTLNYELNDPSDLESVYTRSDHYSYALKGIPVIFFTTGLHPDYHANTDEVSKIEFEKMTRIVQLVYETGRRVANLSQAPVRDLKGPRAGKATSTASR